MHSLTVAVSMAIKQQVNTDKQAKKESEMTHSKQLRILHIYEIYICLTGNLKKHYLRVQT